MPRKKKSPGHKVGTPRFIGRKDGPKSRTPRNIGRAIRETKGTLDEAAHQHSLKSKQIGRAMDEALDTGVQRRSQISQATDEALSEHAYKREIKQAELNERANKATRPFRATRHALKVAEVRAVQQDILSKHTMLGKARKVIEGATKRLNKFGKLGVVGEVASAARAIHTGRAIAASRAEGPRAGKGQGRDFGLFRPKPKRKR